MNEEERNQKMMELQFMSQQVQQMQEHIQTTQRQMVELASVAVILDEVNKSEKGDNTLFSLGAGVFGFGKLDDTKKIIMNVGAKTAVEKSIPEAKTIVEEQINELEKMNSQIEGDFIELHGKMQELQQELINASRKK
jgi:prefoldin alpha subunit